MAVSLLKPPHGGFRSETAVTKPFRKWKGHKFLTAICNDHSPTDTSVCSGVTAVAAGQSQRFYSGVGIFNWYYLSSPPQILRFPVVELETRGLILLRVIQQQYPVSCIMPLPLSYSTSLYCIRNSYSVILYSTVEEYAVHSTRTVQQYCTCINIVVPPITFFARCIMYNNSSNSTSAVIKSRKDNSWLLWPWLYCILLTTHIHALRYANTEPYNPRSVVYAVMHKLPFDNTTASSARRYYDCGRIISATPLSINRTHPILWKCEGLAPALTWCYRSKIFPDCWNKFPLPHIVDAGVGAADGFGQDAGCCDLSIKPNLWCSSGGFCDCWKRSSPPLPWTTGSGDNRVYSMASVKIASELQTCTVFHVTDSEHFRCDLMVDISCLGSKLYLHGRRPKIMLWRPLFSICKTVVRGVLKPRCVTELRAFVCSPWRQPQHISEEICSSIVIHPKDRIVGSATLKKKTTKTCRVTFHVANIRMSRIFLICR